MSRCLTGSESCFSGSLRSRLPRKVLCEGTGESAEANTALTVKPILRHSKQTWIKPRNRKFLAPGWALSKHFRKRVEEAFKEAGLHQLVPREVWSPKGRWVVHVKRLDSGIAGLKYLARYLYRVALNNRSIESFDGESVTCCWQESKTGRTHHTRLEVFEFIALFSFTLHSTLRGSSVRSAPAIQREGQVLRLVGSRLQKAPRCCQGHSRGSPRYRYFTSF